MAKITTGNTVYTRKTGKITTDISTYTRKMAYFTTGKRIDAGVK
jgi:hypothetical protein